MNKNKGAKGLMNQMGALKVNLPDDLDSRFRTTIFKSKGMKKGNIQEAVQEAIEMWVSTKEKGLRD